MAVPNSRRVVTAAMQAKVMKMSGMGSVAGKITRAVGDFGSTLRIGRSGLAVSRSGITAGITRWSPAHREAKPHSSALRATASCSAGV